MAYLYIPCEHLEAERRRRGRRAIPYFLLALVLAASLWVWWLEYKSVPLHRQTCQSVYACTEHMANNVLGPNDN